MLNEIDVAVSDSPTGPIVQVFEIQYWDGSAWKTITGGVVMDNDMIWSTCPT